MEPNGRDDGRHRVRPQLLTESERRETNVNEDGYDNDVVFDFTGLEQPDVRDLSLILTARMQSGPEDRVWVRALPYGTWSVLRSLGVDHLFHLYPYPNEEMD
jgi:hypothetical protein